MTVKTLAEVHADRVVVTVTLNTDYDPSAAADVLAENYERARQRARQRIRELESSLARRMAEIGRLESTISDLEADIMRRVKNTGELERLLESLRTSRDEWRTKFEAGTQARQDMGLLLTRVRDRLDRVACLVDSSSTRHAIEHATSPLAVSLGDVIDQIREIVSE